MRRKMEVPTVSPLALKYYHLFSTKKTQVEMLRDRGYIIEDDERDLFLGDREGDITDEEYREFQARYSSGEPRRFMRSLMSRIYENEDGERTKVVVAPATNKNRGSSAISKFVADALEDKVGTAILISDFALTPNAKSELAKITKPRIQVFVGDELLINPTKHKFVPRHEKVSAEEKEAILKKIPIKNLPNICKNDAITRYYDWSTGDLIRIYRVNLATERLMVHTSIFFRIVSSTNIVQPKPPAKKEKQELTYTQALGLE